MRLGLLTDVVPVHKNVDGRFVANPLVVTDRYSDEMGRIVYGDWKAGPAADAAKAAAKACTVDLSLLDEAVDKLATKLLYTFPDCTRKTLESLRKKKLEHWFQNAETSRSWLSLNMNTEAAAGFAAFHYGDKAEREIDFVKLRTRLAEGAVFDDRLVEEVLPASARARRKRGD